MDSVDWEARAFHRIYVVLDIFSRYVVGWTLADRECKDIARQLPEQTIAKQGADPKTLTIHADNGSSMASKTVALLMADLGVTKSHSRPHTSNDDPYSEAQFKTLKYRPDSPRSFDSLQQARDFCREFFTWYNTEHYHSGIAWHTPYDLHHGHAAVVQADRAEVLTAAYQRNPERFVRKHPEPRPLPTAAWINKPTDPEPAPPNKIHTTNH